MNLRKFACIALLTVSACGGDDSDQGDQYFQQGEYQQAVNAYTQHIEYNPEDATSIYNRGRAYEELGNEEQALADYQAAFELDNKNENILMSLGRYYFREKNYQDAAFYFDKITQINPGAANAQYLKGRAFHKAGETNRAIDAYNAAISADSELGEAYLYRGALKIYLKRKSSGCNDLKMAQTLDVAEAESALSRYCN